MSKKYGKHFINYLRVRFFHLRQIIFNKSTNFNYFWKKQDKTKLPNELCEIIDTFSKSDSKEFISGWWKYNNIKDIKSLSKIGIDNYGEIFFHYYTWYGWTDEEINELLISLQDKKYYHNIDIYKKHKSLSNNKSFLLNILLYTLYNLLVETKEFKYLNNLSDETFCKNSHPFIKIDNNYISHDKVNSLLELSEINKLNFISNNSKILEIGAGSGRIADTILSIYPKIKYVICDIPLAIYVSFYRLKKRFNDSKKIFLAININNEEDLKKIISENDIVFIFPHQLKYLERKSIDLTISISAFHEMEKKVIKFYMDQINRISYKLYFTVWKKTLIPFSLKGTILYANKESYHINDKWTEVSNKKSYFPNTIIQKAYLINN